MSFTQAFDERLRRNNRIPQVAMEVGGWQVALRYILNNFGVGILPKSVVLEAGTRVKWRPLDAKLRPVNRLQVVTLATPANAELVKVFIACLR